MEPDGGTEPITDVIARSSLGARRVRVLAEHATDETVSAVLDQLNSARDDGGAAIYGCSEGQGPDPAPGPTDVKGMAMTDTSAMEASDKDYKVYVNGSEKTLESDIVSFDDAVHLAYGEVDPNFIYSVTFEKAAEPHRGELFEGQTVKVKNGTEFDVDRTGKA